MCLVNSIFAYSKCICEDNMIYCNTKEEIGNYICLFKNVVKLTNKKTPVFTPITIGGDKGVRHYRFIPIGNDEYLMIKNSPVKGTTKTIFNTVTTAVKFNSNLSFLNVTIRFVNNPP